MSIHVTAPMLAAFDHFIGAGFIENGAGAAVGNFCQESGEFLIATIFREHPDYSGGVPDALKSGGIAEWLGDRKTAYIAFSSRAEARLGLPKGALLNDLGTQCDFVVYELQTTRGSRGDLVYADLYSQLTSGSRSIANLTANFMIIYERPKLGPTANLDNRIAHAEAVVERARLIKMARAPQPAPPAPIPQAPAPQTTPPIPPATPAPAGPPPISATTAGRRTAELDYVTAMLDELLAERAALEDEIADFEEMAVTLGKRKQIPMKELPRPPAIPPVVQSKGVPMSGMSGTKPAIASSGVWGSIIAMGVPIISQLADYMGHSVDPKLQAAGSIIGGLLALYGRISATTEVTGVLKS